MSLKFCLSGLFLTTVLAISSLRVVDIAVILSLSAIQISIGATVWMAYRAKHEVGFAEAFGMGAAIGFALALVSSQLLRTLLPRQVTWAVLPLIALVLSLRAINRKVLIFDRRTRDFNEFLIIVSGSLIALSTSWYWLIPTAVAISTLTTWSILRKWKANFSSLQKIFIGSVGVLGFVFFTNALRGLIAVEKIRNPVWWSWRFAKIQDPDVLFGESMMHSVGLFGNTDNIFFSGAKIQYHWFSFAWNDTLNSVFQTDSFAISGLAAPLIVIFAIICLVAALAGRFLNSQLSVPLVVLAVSSMCASQIPFLRVLHPYSYSFNFSLIYTFAFVIFLLSTDRTKKVLNLSLVFLFAGMLMGSKVTSGPFLVGGLLIATSWLFMRKDQQRKYHFILSSAAAAAVLIVWRLIFYSPDQKSPNSIKFGIGVIFEQKAFVSSGLPRAVFLTGFLSLLIMIFYSFSGIYWIRRIITPITNFALIFSLSGGLTSLIFGILFFDIGENLAYSIQSAFALILPISIVAICNSKIVFRRFLFVRILATVIIGISSAKISWSLYDQVSGNAVSVVLRSSGAILFPLLIGLLMLLSARIFFGNSLKQASVLLAVLFISSSTLGSYASLASAFYKDGITYRSLSVDDADTISGSPSYRELLTWLRDNSESDDLVATNRYCSDTYETSSNCLALWSLTSAISGRQVLLEGENPPNSQSFAEEKELRRILVEDFVNQPNENLLNELIVYGVRWMVVDHAETQTRNWEKFGTVRFSNEAGTVIELKIAG